jgi:hypothetical protein
MSEIRAATVSNLAGTGPVTLTGQFAAKAWVNFNGTGTVAIRQSGNVSSITDNGVGRYTLTFTNAIEDANYNFVFGGQPAADTVFAQKVDFNQSYTTTSMGMVSGTPTAASDGTTLCVAIVR